MIKNPLANLDFGNWIYGLCAAVIGGGATAVVAAISISPSDPNYINTIIRIFASSAIVSAFMYLKQNPVPKHITETTLTVQTTTATVTQTESKPEEPKTTIQ